MSTVTKRKLGCKEPVLEKSIKEEKIDKSAKFKTQAPRFRNQKVFARVVLSSAVFIIVYFQGNKDKISTLASIKEILSLREHKIECSSYSDSCIPSQCGRFVSDSVISELEQEKLREISLDAFKKLFKTNEASSLTLDINSKKLLNHEDLSNTLQNLIKSLQPKLIDTVAHRFNIPHNTLSLTTPLYISRITNVTTEFSESLHQLHYDMETNKSVQYSLIIFLSSINKDFKGGKLVFEDTETGKKKTRVIVEPKAGRLLGYTAGSENMHILEKVEDGKNLFITISFTCKNKIQ